ncbi:MAG: response regulator [Leptospira sp.]|nr:response regulator [Leptospira sp.]
MSTETILIIDDTPDNLTHISTLLKEKFKVKVATNGAKGLTIAATDPKPNLILLDIMMPEMDGFEVCQKLKGDPNTASIPVVFLSGKSESSDIEKGLSLGAQGFISKPVEPEKLFEIISKFITA